MLLHWDGTLDADTLDKPSLAPPEPATLPEVILCKVCGEELQPAAAHACARCGAPHHADCWAFNGRCSIFGCGGAEAVPFRSLSAVTRRKNMVITEHTRPEFTLAPLIEGMGRKLTTRAKDLPKTLAAGLAGSLATMAGFALFVEGTRSSFLWMGLLFCGLGPGALAPFVAPTQHKRPMLASAISGALFFFCYAMRFGQSRFFWSTLTVATGILFATSVAEGLFGKLTPAGQALGGMAAPVRHLASWGFFLGAILLGAFLNSEVLSALAYQEISVLSVLALVAAVPALEMGKEEHRRRELSTASTPPMIEDA